MTEEGAPILEEYRKHGLAGRVGFGRRPAIIVVDLIRGFTDPTSPLGSDLDTVVEATARLIATSRSAGVPVLYTTTAYSGEALEAGPFALKVPSLALLKRGSERVEIDSRLAPAAGELVIEKHFASAFHGTSFASQLAALRVDTLIVCGATTSGCVRATVVDAIQNGLRPIVPRECVGDRSPSAHDANLIDIEGKYGDVVSLEDVVSYVSALGDEELK